MKTSFYILYGRCHVLCDEGVGRQQRPAGCPLAQYRTSPLFTEAERAALEYATELTRDKKVSTDTFVRLQKFYSEQERSATSCGWSPASTCTTWRQPSDSVSDPTASVS